MSTMTKERAAQIAAGGGFNFDEIAVLARIALASLEAEAVGYVDDEYAELLKQGHIESCSVYAEQGEGCITLFTAPPAPISVPDEATPENIEILASTFAPRGVTYQWDKDECNAAADSWNACRAARLQGDDGNSPVIQDGWVMVPVDATRAMIDAARRVEEDGYDAMHKAMIAAAPQQEVKNG